MKVSRVAEMRELDRKAVEDFGITTEILMEPVSVNLTALVSKLRID